MFAIIPEAAEVPPPEAEELLPHLAVVDYPKSMTRVHWLYTYYLSWSEHPLPFLDKRSALTFPKWKRRPFIHFTNLYYMRWMHRCDGEIPHWAGYAGKLNRLCPDCRRRDLCKEMCALAVAQQRAGIDTNLQMQIGAFLQKLGVLDDRYVASEFVVEPYCDFSTVFDAEVLGSRPPLIVEHKSLVPIPEQEEDECWV